MSFASSLSSMREFNLLSSSSWNLLLIALVIGPSKLSSPKPKSSSLNSHLSLINVEITTSCNIRKDLLIALKMPQRLTSWGRSFVNQSRRCVYFIQLSFNSYLLKRGKLFINNLTNNIKTNNNNNTTTNQMTSNKPMSSRALSRWIFWLLT